MNSFWKQIIIQTILRPKGKKTDISASYSDYKIAKGWRELRISLKEQTKDFFLIALGIFSASFGLKGFLLINRFIDGGATGISLLISALTQIPLYVLLICINIPFIILGSRIISKVFAIKTAFAISGLALCVATIHFPSVTNDNLLIAIFGGFFLGAGVGLLNPT